MNLDQDIKQLEKDAAGNASKIEDLKKQRDQMEKQSKDMADQAKKIDQDLHGGSSGGLF